MYFEYQRRTAVWEGRRATARPREAKWSSGVAAVFFKNEYQVPTSWAVKMYLATVQETANSSAWNHIFNFQRRGPCRRMAWKLQRHSRECAREPMPALPNYGWKEKFAARAELRHVLQEKLRGRGGSSCRSDCVWAMQDRCWCTNPARGLFLFAGWFGELRRASTILPLESYDIHIIVYNTRGTRYQYVLVELCTVCPW